jgi:PIN domain nuclease of toxin-antitoxin system
LGALTVRVLLDTHALLWWLGDDPKLSPTARAAVADPTNEVFVSAASAWEVATKVRIGELPGAEQLASDFADVIAAEGFLPLSITVSHAQRAGLLVMKHRDPFDRMLIAQAHAEDLALVTIERTFAEHGARTLW